MLHLQNFDILANLCSGAVLGLSLLKSVRNPEDSFSRDIAHIREGHYLFSYAFMCLDLTRKATKAKKIYLMKLNRE